MEDATSFILATMAEQAAKKPKAEAMKKRPAGAATKLAAATTCAGIGEKAPCFSDETTRSQILYRSGLKGAGQSKTFKYCNAKSKAEAIAKAEARGVVARLGAAWGFVVWIFLDWKY